ncbi:MAG: hypothetical protein ACJ747_12305 [Gaiellaceae bacterium]|jgi:hypothetical protein
MRLRPLAVGGFLIVALSAPIATIVALSGNVPAILIAIVAWIGLGAYWLRAPAIWSDVDPGRARAAVLGGEVLALSAFALGFLANYAISIDHELCGGGAAPIFALGVAAAVYVGVGALVLRRASQLLWLWPLLVFGLWGTSLVIRFALPGAHGFCET